MLVTVGRDGAIGDGVPGQRTNPIRGNETA
jgi:hypothetical protein